LLLDVDAWDLAADATGNIAVAEEPYSLAQDAASAIRLFLGELYYDTSQGIPFFEQILGRRPPVSLMKAHFNRQAMTVPGVVKSQCFITDWTDRKVSGQVQVWDANGNVSAAGF
jgi:hypothetical protein